MTLLLLGATGTVGRHLTAALATTSARIRLAVHNASPQLSSVETVPFDLANPTAWPRAFQGVTTLFLCTPNLDNQAATEIALIDAARTAGVEKVVKLGALDAQTDGFAIGRIHHQAEQHLAQSGLAYVLLRPNTFMQNFEIYARDSIRAGRFFSAIADAPVSRIDVRDLAEVAAVALTTPRLDGRAIDLTGPHAETDRDVARQLSQVLERLVECVSISDERVLAGLLAAGVPEPHAQRLIDLGQYQRAGHHARCSSEVETILGRPARSFADFASERRQSWAQ